MTSKPFPSKKISLQKVASRVTLAATFFLTSSVGMTASLAAEEKPLALRPSLPAVTDPAVLLAQSQENYLVFNTTNYAVRVFNEGRGTRMNVYDRANNILRLNAAPATFTIEGGNAVYVSTGDYSANTATYKSVVTSNQQVRLIIEIGDGRTINEPAVGTPTIQLPAGQRPTGDQKTRLAFQTTTYAVRVFKRDGNLFMNVYNRFSGQSELNGEAANLADPEPPYECMVSYTASGERNGIPVRYYARINGSGETFLEIYNVNNQRLFQEPGMGAVTIDIPEGDLPRCLDNIDQGVTDAFVAAVFGDENTLREVQQLYPDARMESSSLGDFINAGSFPNRDSATARVLELRGRGFNARVVFRDVRYR